MKNFTRKVQPKKSTAESDKQASATVWRYMLKLLLVIGIMDGNNKVGWPQREWVNDVDRCRASIPEFIFTTEDRTQ